MLLYDGDWLQDGTVHHFHGCKGKGIEVKKSTTYEGLMRTVCDILKVDPAEHNISMKYVFSANIPTSPIELRDDGDVRFFIRLNSTAEKLPTPLCVSVEKRSAIHGHQSVSNTEIDCPTLFGMENEINEEPIVMNSLDPLNQSVPLSDFDAGNTTQVSYNPVEYDDGPELDMHKEDEDCGMNVTLNNDGQVMQDEVMVISSREQVTVGSGQIGDDHLQEQQIYSNKKELQKKLSMHALRSKFQFKTVKSSTKLLHVACVHEECNWRVRATKLGNSDLFEIRQYHSIHTCSLDMISHDDRHASSLLIGDSIREVYEGVGRQYRAKDIVDDFRKKYGVSINYTKAWRARELALSSIRGSPEESYGNLPSYCYVLEQKNPGTVTDIVTDQENRFKYFFMALGASLSGFRTSIRPVIAVDGTFLKSKYLGTLFVAACKDGNNQIYPLCFGIGDSENDASWEWFMGKLGGAIGHVEDLVVVSDRHSSIEKAVRKVFPHAIHGVCTYHLLQNLKTKFKNVEVHKLYNDAAYTYRLSEFNLVFHHLHLICPRAATYLNDVGIRRWSRSHSSGKRYNIMTTGIAESVNAVLKDARELPIVPLVEELRNLLQKWFSNRHQQGLSMTTEFTTWADGELRQRYNTSTTYEVQTINSKEYNVRYNGVSDHVNLHTRSCTCRQFDLDHIPCAHAIAASKYAQISCYSICSEYYTVKSLLSSYAESIYPPGPQRDWVVPNDISMRVVLPPITRRPAGRPRKERIPSGGEGKRSRRCGRCGDYGHNRKSCKRPIPLHHQNDPSGDTEIGLQDVTLDLVEEGQWL